MIDDTSVRRALKLIILAKRQKRIHMKDSIAYVSIELWVKCPHCKRQMNDIMDRNHLEPIMEAMKSGKEEAKVICSKCKQVITVIISNA